MLRHAADNMIFTKGSLWLLSLWSLLFFSACSPSDRQEVDRLNSISYACHYRDLDSTYAYARRAYALADNYAGGRAAALNNMAFADIARMDYERAGNLLDSVFLITDNQVELLVAEVQWMRICQRTSRNRLFYDYRERASRRIKRIDEERSGLPEDVVRRIMYAETEFAIVNSAYYYYVGLDREAADALSPVVPDDVIRKDTAQYLNYLYNVGAGGIITEGSQADINQREFDMLIECLTISRRHGYRFFEANALGAISGLLLVPEHRARLAADNAPAMKYLNPDGVPEASVPEMLAEECLRIFRDYGDVYQIAGAHRTLASCFMASGDYEPALKHLAEALSDNRINQAPDLVASIREQLSVAYSAIDDKPTSDYNRNIYISLQEQTRQDRYLEARADMLDKISAQLNSMITAVVVAILLLVFMLWLFYYLNRRNNNTAEIDRLLLPLRQWREREKAGAEKLLEQAEEIKERQIYYLSQIKSGERLSLENRAKVFLVTSITPLIDRMINEVRLLAVRSEDEDTRNGRYTYISELAAKINEYNDVLTEWIQMRRGQLDLRIESFALQPLFDIVSKGGAAFRMGGVRLDVSETDAVVKADKVLTMFMINTLADNARKFTGSGGSVTVSAVQHPDFVEISVADTGEGLTAEELARVFDRKSYDGHGFGLMNCKGIIEKYRKTSRLFSVCDISAESTKGEGSRFFFRLPVGVARTLAVAVAVLSSICSMAAGRHSHLYQAKQYADSAYFSNINGTYAKTLQYADSCREHLNRHYLSLYPDSKLLMKAVGSQSSTPPEIKWLHDSVSTNYSIILDIRNESAVAALALHRWQLYSYNNKIYTQLFKELSADSTLADYCRMMQQSQTNKTIAVILLVMILIIIPPAYYLLYYRHRLYYRFCIERIEEINRILSDDSPPAVKLRTIDSLAGGHYPADLQKVVDSIREVLSGAVASRNRMAADIELEADACRKAEYECSNLHVSNSVIDNCLSTLKHETMYYPSRISRLSVGSDDDRRMMGELVMYYRDIYAILSMQAVRQTEAVRLHACAVPVGDVSAGWKVIHAGGDTAACFLGDRNMLGYLFEILRRQCTAVGQTAVPEMTVSAADDRYVSVVADLGPADGDAGRYDAFTPSVNNIPFLLCRQIVREHSELTNRHRCGMRVSAEGGRKLAFITLPGYIVKT